MDRISYRDKLMHLMIDKSQCMVSGIHATMPCLNGSLVKSKRGSRAAAQKGKKSCITQGQSVRPSIRTGSGSKRAETGIWTMEAGICATKVFKTKLSV